MEFINHILDIIKFILFVLPWCGTLWGAHQKLYSSSIRYFFFIKKIINRIKDTNWKLTAMYSVENNADFWNVLDDIISERFGNYRKSFNLHNKRQYEFKYYSLIVQYNLENSDSEFVKIELLFSNMNVTYKNALERLSELRKFFIALERKLMLDNNNIQYNFDIVFSDFANPFYGVLIQRLGPEHIEYFECVLNPDVLSDRRVINTNRKISVFKDKINICDSNFDNIEEIAKKCLLLEV